MSAESPNRSRSQTRGRGGPVTVSPQQVTDPTILDSVAGFINDVVPTAYNLPCDTEDQIQWAHFEQPESDCTSLSSHFDGDGYIPPALVLVLGYASGIQVWAVPASGEATEILSWRHGSCKVLKIIPTPNNNTDLFATARPLIALCDSISNHCTLSFRSLRSGIIDPVKQIQFKSSILNVLANKRSLLVTFSERIAVFDACTLESRASITTCYLSPGINPNPVALGSRWLAYAEKKIISANRSSGGNEGEGVQSYTATVLHAAKSLGRGLRELTETVAGSLTGNPITKIGIAPSSPQAGGLGDVPQKGVVTILDTENKNINPKENIIPQDAVIAHFVAHNEAIVCLLFDPTGMLLLTADKRGHDFHLFRIQPHPGGPQLAAVHHLYILHRGDTSAKVQDMCFSPDSRWVTVSTLRGTTHVFPVTPYGGNVSVRTHATAHVVNKMSRYQRSAGLTSEGRSSSPVSLLDPPVNSLLPYRNPRFPPYPQPNIIGPLAQIRQPLYIQNTGSLPQRQISGRQRLSSSSEDNITLRIVTCFSPPRAWMDCTKIPRETSHKQSVKRVESLFIMSCNGTLVQYDLDPIPSVSVPRERICNDTAIELKVCAKAQWLLQRGPNNKEVSLPMSEEFLNYLAQDVPNYKKTKSDHNDDYWLSQVEIVTHLGPHRRLWMGPQFTFKTYTISNGAVVETRPIDVRRSKPVNMPVSKANAILIESGSASSCEQLFLDTYHRANEEVGSAGELQLKEDLADAMLESPGIREGGHCVIVSMKPPVTKVVNPLGTVVTLQSDDEQDVEIIEDAVIHENCDEALFRPVVAPKAIFYAESLPRTCPPDNILVKSVQPNTKLAVKIINKFKHINNKPKSRETSPINKSITKLKKIDKNKNKNFIDEPLDLPDFPDVFQEPQIEEEKVTLKKSRRPKTKLGVKIASNRENKEEQIPTPSPPTPTPLPPPKRSWNLVAAAKPEEKEEKTESEDSVVEFTIKLPTPKLDEMEEDLIKIDKSSDDEKVETSSPAETTTESDDSSNKIPEIVSIMDVKEEEELSMEYNGASKSSRRKSKKKRKGGGQSADLSSKDEDLSSASSFSSASRASPTPSYSDNLLHFPGDSSSSM